MPFICAINAIALKFCNKHKRNRCYASDQLIEMLCKRGYFHSVAGVFSIFSRRFSSEKSQTITVTSFFSSDHRPHRICTTFYRLHSFTCTRQYSLYSVYGEPSSRVLTLARNFSSNFFRHCATLSIFFGALGLFLNFFPSKGPTFKFF